MSARKAYRSKYLYLLAQLLLVLGQHRFCAAEGRLGRYPELTRVFADEGVGAFQVKGHVMQVRARDLFAGETLRVDVVAAIGRLDVKGAGRNAARRGNEIGR